MERGELPSREMAGRLLGRTLWLAVAAFGLVSLGAFLAEYLVRHGFDPPVLPYGGWQVDLVLAAYAVVGLTLIASAWVMVRRTPNAAGTPRSYQVTAAVIAVLIGGNAAAAFHHQPERAYNWAAAKTGSAHRFAETFARQTLRDFGDATHPPILRSPGAPASAAQAAPLIGPSDLGRAWHYAGSPQVTVGHPDAAGVQYSARTFLTAEHWTGTIWAGDQTVVESATSYTTNAEAKAAGRQLNREIEACSLPSACSPAGNYVRSDSHGLIVWIRGDEPSISSLRATLIDGSLVIDVLVSPGLGDAVPPLTGTQILHAAIRRIELATRSK